MWLRFLPILAILACNHPSPDVSRDVAQNDAVVEARASDSVTEAARHFTQAFYDWYGQHDNRLETAVASQAGLFAPELLEALSIDLQAQADNPGEIVGLDWDPFTASQDPCNPYRVDSVTRRGDTALVAVRGMCTDAAPRATPDAIAEVSRSASGWIFVNFRYPDRPETLLDDLATLRAARQADSVRVGNSQRKRPN